MPTRRIAVMGGAFDPIHIAHLLDAEAARDSFDLDEVVFVPNNAAPFGKHGLAPAGTRMEMVRASIADNSAFSVSSVEIARGGVSYSVDTVKAIRSERGDIGALYFITGADAIETLTLWRSYEELCELVEFIAVTRPGYDLAAIESGLPPAAKGRVNFLPIPALEISSTMIRDRVRAGKSVRYLVPEAVREIMLREGLYV